MKTRNQLSAGEVDALIADLERRLHGVGIETQPEVAAKIVGLISDAGAGLRDYANVIKADPALTGRLLRLANSAFFAQRQPVSNLERACVLLGLGRLKAVSMGFYLSRASVSDATHKLSRRVWGQSVYRACLAAELAQHACPTLASEAFVAGLMLDAGVPVLVKFLGEDALAIAQSGLSPAKQFRKEFETLPFTHVDVVAAMIRRWRLPDPLAKPIERHHIQPAEGVRPDPIHTLHRIVYYAGALQLDDSCRPAEAAPLPLTAERALGLTVPQLSLIVRRASDEYGAMCEIFREVAESIGDMDDMVNIVQSQLVEIMDQTLMDQFKDASKAARGSFRIADRSIEIEPGLDNLAVAYLNDASGTRLLSYTFRPDHETAADVLDALGLEFVPPQEQADLDLYLRSLAA